MLNQSYTTATRFGITLDSPEFEGFSANVVDYTIPGVRVEPAVQSTPHRDVPLPGTKAIFETLALRVLMDRGFETYKKIFDWMIASATDESQVRDLVATGYSISDAAVVMIRYKDAFPTDLGSVSFTTSDNNDSIPKFDVTLEYSEFVIEVI